MKPVYVLDACAMLAVLAGEPGTHKVEEIYKKQRMVKLSY